MTRKALITGASSGIGRGVALRFARDGWHIVAQGRREDALADTRAQVEAAGGSCETVTAEMGDMEDIARLAEAATADGRLDAMVHCAAKFTYGEVSTERFADWDRSIDEVLRATIRLSAHVLPAMKAAGGAYVYICGPTSWEGWKRHSIHCALRHAQLGFAKALFEEVREEGVRVTVIHPGFVNTEGISNPALLRGKMIQVEDIAEMIAQAVTLPATACVTELKMRPQRSPYP